MCINGNTPSTDAPTVDGIDSANDNQEAKNLARSIAMQAQVPDDAPVLGVTRTRASMRLSQDAPATSPFRHNPSAARQCASVTSHITPRLADAGSNLVAVGRGRGESIPTTPTMATRISDYGESTVTLAYLGFAHPNRTILPSAPGD